MSILDLQMQQANDHLDTNVIECDPNTDSEEPELTGCLDYDETFHDIFIDDSLEQGYDY